MPGGEVAIGMEVHDQALGGVEDLDEQRRVGTVPGDVLRPEEGLRRETDRVAERLAVLQPGQAGTRPGEDRSGGTDPVLGGVLGRLRGAAKPRDARAAAIERRWLI